MNNNTRINLMQGLFRTGVCLFMLSGTCVLFAQNETPAEQADAPKKEQKAKEKAPAKKVALKEVKGKVFDAATGSPLGGVRVQSLGNSLYSALTEDDGSYTIKVPEFENLLLFTISDYNPMQLAMKGNEGQDVQMMSAKLRAFYEDKISLTNRKFTTPNETSATTADDEIENELSSSVRAIKRGGMPGQGVTMFINGLNSLNSTAQPLIVVDGVIWDGQYDRSSLHDGFFINVLSVIDPEDIASIEVHKNGTGLYGARGGNGVIEITTKRGKSMATRINVRAFGSYEMKPSTTKMMNGQQYRSYVTDMLGTRPDNEYLASSMSIPFLNEDPSYLFYPLYHNDTDWQKDLYRNSFAQNYKVSVEGGDDVAMYNLSLGYTKSDATTEKNDFNRLNIRFNTDVNLLKNLTAAIDIAFSRNSYNLRDNGWAPDYTSRHISSPNVLGQLQAPILSPYAYYVRYDNNALNLVSSSVYAGKNYSDSNNPFRFAETFGYSGLVNPFWILENGEGDNKNYQEQMQFSMNIAPKYRINKYLTIQNRFSYIMNRNDEKYYLPTNGTPVKNVPNMGDATSFVASQVGKETTLFDDINIRWKRSYQQHNVDLFGGFRFASYSYNASSISGYNNENDKMPNISGSLDNLGNGGVNDKWKNLAYYFNAGYNFANKYFINAGVTMETSSRFGKDTKSGLHMCGISWGMFPSVQAAWLISSEKWFNVKFIDYMKISLGYDETGNDNVDYYASRTYFENMKFMDKKTGLVLSNVQNPNIQWETTHRVNLGLETSMLKNRLTLAFEFFRSNTTNLLTRKAVSDIIGLPYIWVNDGAMENNGVEFRASGVILNKKDWQLQAGFSIGHYKNKITELPESDLNHIETYNLDENGKKNGLYSDIHGYTTSIYGTDNILTAVGRPAGVFYGYETAGVFSTDAEAAAAHTNPDGTTSYLKYPTGLSQNPYRNFRAGDVHFVDQNGDGWIDEADKVVIGDPNPKIYGNFFAQLRWKDLTLDLNFKYSVGNDVFNYQRMQTESANSIYNQTTAVCNRWRYQGQVTEVPRACDPSSDFWVNNERFSDRWIEDGSYLKLKKVRLSYKVPVKWDWLLGLSVWAESSNVFTVSKYTGNDPEVSCGNGVLYQGIDAGLLPQNRNFTLGLTINL